MSKKNWFRKMWGKRYVKRDGHTVSREMTVLRRYDDILEKCKLIIDYCIKDNDDNKLELEAVIKQHKEHEEISHGRRDKQQACNSAGPPKT